MTARLAFGTALTAVLILPATGCGPTYSPDTYATTAVQQANKAEQGVVIGVREVAISASGTVGAVTGGAAGGLAGAQVGVGPVSAFSALGGSLVGGLIGTATERATADTKGFEYIVRKGSGDLVSVTQKDTTPLAIGQKVLVIAGNQARVVPDYTITEKAEAPARPAMPPAAAPPSEPRASEPAANSGLASPGDTPVPQDAPAKPEAGL